MVAVRLQRKHAIPSHSAFTHMTDVIFKGGERAYAAHLKIVASSSVIAGRFQWKGAELTSSAHLGILAYGLLLPWRFSSGLLSLKIAFGLFNRCFCPYAKTLTRSCATAV